MSQIVESSDVMKEVVNGLKSLSKEVIFSGLLVGSLEPCIEDAIMFSAIGLVSVSNILFLFWIGAVELVGLGQILLLSRFFKNGKRFKAAIILWLLIIPAVFIFFPLGSFLASHIRFLNIWGPITLIFITGLIVGLPFYFPRTKIPLAYISLIVGLVIDIVVSSLMPTRSNVAPLMLLPDVLLCSAIIVAAMGATLILFSYISDRVFVVVNGKTKKKLKGLALAYLFATTGFLAGFLPSIAPIITLGAGLIVLVLIPVTWKELKIIWLGHSMISRILKKSSTFET